jgi:hypothetical protein
MFTFDLKLVIYFQFSLIASASEMKLFIVFAQYKYNCGMQKQNTTPGMTSSEITVNVIYNSSVHIFVNKL